MKVRITQESLIGLLRFTPWEAVVVAADVALKSAAC